MLSWLTTAAVLYAAILLFVMWREKSFIYYPERKLAGAPARAQDVWLTTADGVRLHGWLLPAESNSTQTVLFCHGNAGNISHRLEKLDILRQLGVNVFIFDYRGYGRSEGSPDEQGTYRDAQAAYDFLAGKTIVLYGESLGAAVAVELATKNPVAGIILEEPFTSTADVAAKMFPYLPVRLIARNRYDSLSKIAHINAPLLIFHSRDDEFFAIRHAERLLAAAREPKRLVELRGGHNEAFLESIEIYRASLAEFLGSL